MSKSTRRPQQIFTIVMWLLSVIFAGFLIGLGSLVIRDLPQVDRAITIEQFTDQTALTRVNTAERTLENGMVTLRRAVEDTQEAAASASADYLAAQASFRSWIATRTATESNAQNPEVIRRTRALEALKAEERDATRAVEDAQMAQRNAERELADLRAQRTEIMAAARPEYNAARRWQELRVFLFRLAVTLPLLLAGAWMLAKKRGSAYWPMYRGFVLFALFAFFVELVPYLPSYGGYVRFIVGIILVAVAGHYIIKAMRKYMARKQAEEARSEQERRQSIEYEVALKKIAAKTCPGCDRSIVTRDGVHTDFCVHCGIRLQSECHACGHRNVSFHRFCLSCGTPNKEASPRPALPREPVPDSGPLSTA